MNYTIRRHLGKGQHYGWFQIRGYVTDAKQGEVVEYVNPEQYDIVFTGCRVHNKKNQAAKILAGANKAPIAWLIAEGYEVRPKGLALETKQLEYNPKKSATWVVIENGETLVNDADASQFETVITRGTKLYI